MSSFWPARFTVLIAPSIIDGGPDEALEVELRDPPTTPVYQQIAAEAVEMDADGTPISLISSHFGVDPNTAKKAIAWFYERGTRS